MTTAPAVIDFSGLKRREECLTRLSQWLDADVDEQLRLVATCDRQEQRVEVAKRFSERRAEALAEFAGTLARIVLVEICRTGVTRE
jgi:hypothetical protein